MTGLAASQSVLDQPGTVAFLVVFGMGVLLFFVFRSMSRHLRKIAMMARADEEAAARAQQGEPGAGGESDGGAGSPEWGAAPASGGLAGDSDLAGDTASGWAEGTADGTGYARRRT